jgi:hypothetical protein
MTREELAAALRKADAAGNADDARRLAGAIRQLDAGPAVQAPARPAMDPLHMVNPAARAQVQANQPMRSLPMSPLGPGNERYAPPKPPPQGDPLAPANPQAAAANVDAQQRARGLVPYTNASTGETYWRPDPARQVADANAQFRAREAAKASAAQAQAENEAFRNSRPEIVNQASDAIRGGFAATENAAFDVVDAGLDAVDPRRKVSQFISQNVTPAAEQVGRGIGDFVEGPSGRFGGMAGPAVGAITGGLSELGATMARDPQDASTQIVDALEPTHMLARGVNTSGDALDAAMGGDFGRSGNLMAQAVPDLIGGSGVLPAMSVTANALRTAARAPQRELAEQLARIQPLPATGRVPMSAPRVAPTVAQTAQQAPTQPQTVTAPPVPPIPPNAPAVTAGAAQPVPARSRAEQRADDLLIKKLAADGITMDDVRKIQARLARRGDSGVYETIGEIAALTDKSSGANLRGLQMAGGAAPGPLQEALVGLVNQNTEKLSPRLSRGATRATGQKADNAVATLDELETRLRTEATPAYDDAYATPVNPQVFANEILPVLNTPSGQKALQAARNNLASIAADLQGRAARGASERAMMESQRAQAAVKSIDDFMADPVRGTAIPTTMALDYTKRAFDDVIADAGFGSDTARIVGGTKRNFADSVSQATGGQYGNALGVFEDVKRLEDAFEVGTQALNKKTWELERELAKGRGGSPWTAGEVEALAMGVARNIEDLIEANNQSALTKLLKDKALKNMATALGSQKAADMFEETIRRLGANREWGRRVAGGSDTAMRQAAIRDAGMEGEDAITRVLDRVETSGNQFSLPGLVNDVAVKPIARTAKDIYQRLRYPGVYDEEVNRALIPLIGKPMTEGNLNEVIRRVEARMAEKGLIPPAQPAAVAAPPPAPRRRPRGPGGNPPGTTSSASATGTGIVAGGVLGAMAPADDENEQFINALFTAAGVGTAAGVAAKLTKGGKPPPASGKGAKPKAPPSAPRSGPPGVKPPPVKMGFGGKPPAGEQYDFKHLDAIKDRLAREQGRLGEATTAKEREFRAVQVSQAEKELANEIKFLKSKGITPPDEMSIDDLAAELEGFDGAGMSGNSRGIADNLKQDAALAGFGSVGGSFANQDDPQAGALAGMGLALGGKYGPRAVNAMRGAGRVKPPPVRGAAQGKFRGPNNQTFAGVNAKTADKVALARAQNMEAEGAGRDAIWDETGWFKGVDGKWRFEIDDSGAKIGSEAALVFNGGRPYPSTMQNVMEHPELYAAYPDMATDAGMIARRNSAAGVYEPELKSATAIAPDLENARSIMLHEAGGHGVQAREGFAAGGSPENMLMDELKAINDEMSKLARQMDVLQKNKYYSGRPPKEVDAEVAALKQQYDDLMDRRSAEISPAAQRDAYNRLAGEAEARNVQTRDAMRTRGEKPGRPWETQDVPDDRQLIRFRAEGGKAESRPKPPPKGQTGNALAGKPPKGPPGTLSRMVAGGAVGGIAGGVAGEAGGQEEDLTAEMNSTKKDIDDLNAALKTWDSLDVMGKQRLLIQLGRVQSTYVDKNGARRKFDDGTTGDRTEPLFKAYAQEKRDALEKAEAGLEALKKQSAYRQFQKEQNPFFDAVRELGPSGAMALAGAAATVLRIRGVGKSKAAVKVIEKDINDLLTNGPVKSLLKKGGAANTERNRAVNMNEFYRQGGAPDSKLPFNYGAAGYKPNPKAAKPGSLYSSKTTTKMDGVGSQFLRPNDIKVLGVGLLDSVAIMPFVSGAEEELKKAKEDVDNGNDSIEALRRVEKAKTDLAMYQTIQRIGWGLAGGGALGAAYRYKLPKPDIRGAEEEVAAIGGYLRSIAPPKTPRAPKALAPPATPQTPPVAGPPAQLLLPAPSPPLKKPKPKPKPKPKKP